MNKSKVEQDLKINQLCFCLQLDEMENIGQENTIEESDLNERILIFSGIDRADLKFIENFLSIYDKNPMLGKILGQVSPEVKLYKPF